jgi:hypothetical protein
MVFGRFKGGKRDIFLLKENIQPFRLEEKTAFDHLGAAP